MTSFRPRLDIVLNESGCLFEMIVFGHALFDVFR